MPVGCRSRCWAQRVKTTSIQKPLYGRASVLCHTRHKSSAPQHCLHRWKAGCCSISARLRAGVQVVDCQTFGLCSQYVPGQHTRASANLQHDSPWGHVRRGQSPKVRCNLTLGLRLSIITGRCLAKTLPNRRSIRIFLHVQTGYPAYSEVRPVPAFGPSAGSAYWR